MQQYFVDFRVTVGETFILDNQDDCFHLKKVMRAKVGTQIEVVAEQRVYLCEIVQLEPNIELLVLTEEDRNAELPIAITIIQGLPKLDKMELIIQKGTELGANTFIPWHAKRSIVKYDGKKASQKLQRWQKIAKEAAEQAHRNCIPEVQPIKTTAELAKELLHFDAVFIGSERVAKMTGQQNILPKQLQNAKVGMKIACIIGPEGGIDDEEFQFFIEQQAIETAFGPRILRTETAPLYFLSAVSFACE